MSSTSEQQPTDTSGHDKPLLPEGYCIKGFVVQRMVGSGACSEVYQVQQQGTGAQMALKLLRWPIHCKMPYPLSPQDACKVCLDLENGPFGREYSAYHSLGALHFPAVRMEGIPFVEKFGTLCLGGKDRRQYCFCVTDLLGPDLHRAFLDTCGAHITAQQFVLLGKGMLRALQRAHTCGLVHRDVKPENFCLSTMGADLVPLLPAPVYLTDWDFAIKYDPTHAPGAKTVWWGTPDYASISSLEGHPQTPRDDVESLSYTLLLLATDTLPWDDATKFATEHRRIMRELWEDDRQLKADMQLEQEQRGAAAGGAAVSTEGGGEDGAGGGAAASASSAETEGAHFWDQDCWGSEDLEAMAEGKVAGLSDAIDKGLVPPYMCDFIRTVRSLQPHDPMPYDFLGALLERALLPLAPGQRRVEVWHWNAASPEAEVAAVGGARAAANVPVAPPPLKAPVAWPAGLAEAVPMEDEEQDEDEIEELSEELSDDESEDESSGEGEQEGGGPLAAAGEPRAWQQQAQQLLAPWLAATQPLPHVAAAAAAAAVPHARPELDCVPTGKRQCNAFSCGPDYGALLQVDEE